MSIKDLFLKITWLAALVLGSQRLSVLPPLLLHT
jgi:hypothetical protein